MLRRRGALTAEDVRSVVDYLCTVAKPQSIFYLWRPLVRDPKDDMVAEVAVAAGATAIVTHNVRDFSGIEPFGIKVMRPGAFLKKIGGLK